MPSNASAIARTVRLFCDSNLSPAALSANLAATARQTRDQVIAAKEAPPSYTTTVDGRAGATEDAVRPDGKIIYLFSSLGAAAAFALDFCATHSPVDSGDFSRAWFVAVDGRAWGGNLNAIPPGAKVTITNPLPYARKIEVGHMRMSVPRGIVASARRAVQKQYPAITTEAAFVTIPDSQGGGYVLKGRFTRGFRKKARRELLKDVSVGQQMTYPALKLSAGAR